MKLITKAIRRRFCTTSSSFDEGLYKDEEEEIIDSNKYRPRVVNFYYTH